MAPAPELSDYEEVNFEGIDEDLAAFQEDEMVQQALHRGVDLMKYGAELETDLRKVENESVALYVEHGPAMATLHNQLQDCDRVLGRMEEMLHGFQADLGEISSEIRHLQDNSLSMSVKLKNRRVVEDKIHNFLENVQIPPFVAQQINSPNVNEAFQDAVVVLNRRIKYMEQEGAASDGSSLDLPPSETLYVRTLLPDLEKLKIKAIGKIREYFSTQFAGLRRPKTNVLMVQQSALIKYAKLFQFLNQEANVVADDLRSVYVETMGKTIHSLFKSYVSQLMKHELIVAHKGDVVVVDESAVKSLFAQKDATKRVDAFALGERGIVLDQIEKEPLLVHIMVAEGTKLPFEQVLRSVLKHLIDAASNEFIFILDFFRTQPKDTFNRIFGKTLAHLLEILENYLLTSNDCVGLLLMIRVTHLLRLVMQRRRIPVLDLFFDRVSLLLWPRFKQVLDAHSKSIKACVVKKLGAVDTAPHLVVRRYAELISSIILLQSTAPVSQTAQLGSANLPPGPEGQMPGDALGVGGGGELMVHQDVQLLRQEMIGLMERMTAGLGPKDQRVFFVNNYDLMLTIFQERGVTSEEAQRVEGLLLQQREHFAEEEIKAFFPRLRAFVLQAEQQWNEANPSASLAPAPMRRGSIGNAVASSTGTKAITLDDAVVESLVRDFATTWRTGIQQINDDVLTYFANLRGGMEILKQVLTQLLLYYSRFQDLIKRCYARPPAFVRDIVSTATILMEIKRYSRNF